MVEICVEEEFNEEMIRSFVKYPHKAGEMRSTEPLKWKNWSEVDLDIWPGLKFPPLT